MGFIVETPLSRYIPLFLPGYEYSLSRHNPARYVFEKDWPGVRSMKNQRELQDRAKAFVR